MSKTFSSSYANVTISDPTYNPVSITTSGTITGTATALYSDLAALTITNSGKVAGGSGGGKAGVSLHSGGGLISNQSGGTITGTYGIVLTAGGRAVNAGGIAGSGAAFAKGVQFGASGEVTNQSGGVITGNYDGVFASSGSLTVVNAGSIADTLNAALDLRGAASGGQITGGVQGIAISGDVGTITNQGTIIGQGAAGAGVALAVGGFVSNTSSGTISAGRFGVVANSAATELNDGSLNGSSYDGIALLAGGTASNSATGRITGGSNGIYVHNAGGTVTNAGTVTGNVGINLLAGWHGGATRRPQSSAVASSASRW